MSDPLNKVRSLLDEQIHVKLRDNRELSGRLFAFDEHCNLVMGNALETVYSLDDTLKVKTEKNENELLFVRGDSIVFIREQIA